MGISDAMDSRVRRALLGISAAQFYDGETVYILGLLEKSRMRFVKASFKLYFVEKCSLARQSGKSLVGMAEVEAAIQEMFQAPHIQLAMTVSCLCTSNGEAFPGHDMLLKIGKDVR
ncbi:unnamed protein product [Prunus armeniaca]